jgi:hypothetical protein
MRRAARSHWAARRRLSVASSAVPRRLHMAAMRLIWEPSDTGTCPAGAFRPRSCGGTSSVMGEVEDEEELLNNDAPAPAPPAPTTLAPPSCSANAAAASECCNAMCCKRAQTFNPSDGPSAPPLPPLAAAPLTGDADAAAAAEELP